MCVCVRGCVRVCVYVCVCVCVRACVCVCVWREGERSLYLVNSKDSISFYNVTQDDADINTVLHKLV